MNATVNEEVRRTAKAKKIPLWAVACELAISEASMTRKMRHELEPNEKQRILKIINDLASEKSGTE